jgi:hypothetical protein
VESDAEVLSEINDGVCAVGADAREKDRASAALVNCLCRLHCGREDASPKVASPAPRVTSPAQKMANAPLRVASVAPKLAPKVSAPTPKPPVEQVKEPGIAAKQAIRPAAKKAVEARPEPVRPTKPKTAAVNGKLVVKKSKKEAR